MQAHSSCCLTLAVVARDDHFTQFQDDLRMLTSRMDEDGQLSKLILYAEKTKDKESNFLKRLTGLDDDDPTAEVVSNALKKKAEFTKAAVVRLLETIQGWLAKRERFLADLAIEKGA
ncbi:hypothetical protein BC938DRAFT_476488 [Jimgerdemannia flammicorona]|uniref:Uncharacterized protein n=1 Tax=Jimgerdemannia flammicorona TaxID=994334 RepID=A0A433PGR9_9FUNG|nr:hypothetical protein BC938DRAFT_476488 [Jimgerdemannia flammicorona]